MPDAPTPPGPEGVPLSGRDTALRPVDPGDIDFLYELATCGEIGFRWRYRGQIPSIETFAQTLHQNLPVQLVVWSRAEPERIGHVVAYELNLRDRTASIGMAIAPGLVGTGWPIEAAQLFVDYLFVTWDLRKIYGEAPSYNIGSFVSGMGDDFVEEGRLRQHLYFDGRHWDLHIMALYRERWLELRDRRRRRAEAAARLREVVGNSMRADREVSRNPGEPSRAS